MALYNLDQFNDWEQTVYLKDLWAGKNNYSQMSFTADEGAATATLVVVDVDGAPAAQKDINSSFTILSTQTGVLYNFSPKLKVDENSYIEFKSAYQGEDASVIFTWISTT